MYMKLQAPLIILDCVNNQDIIWIELALSP